jgi:VWFA-related protein
MVTGDGLIRLDVVVTDKSGKSVAGLEPRDFTLLDNGVPEKILSFQASDGITAKPDAAVEVILVIDRVNLQPNQIALAKSEAEKFLRKNHGHLGQPVSLYLLSTAGLSSMPAPSTDGNALAEAIVLGRDLPIARPPPQFRVGQSYVGNGQIFKMTPGGVANRSSLQSLASIAIEERRRPARKLLFWLGPGWPVGVDGEDVAFDSITELSTRLREARISLWTATEWPYPDTKFFYQDFMAPIKSGEKVKSGNLALDVLAIQSGGGLLNTSSELTTVIDKCIEQESIFYTLTFDPPPTNEVDDYRDLKSTVSKPDLTARTNTGYYNEPVYHDHPSEAKGITVQELEQMLETAHGSGDKEVAQELFGVELTERMSSSKLSSWKARLPGERSRAALVAVADKSAFLALPAADIPTTATPDPATRRMMLSRTIDYLSKTIVKLPNFFATRTTVQYDEPPQKDEQAWKTVTSDQSLHVTETFNTTVTFRDGKEVVDPKARRIEKLNSRERDLDTQGTFGPILAMVFVGTSAAHSVFTWSHWEQDADKPQAVFRYAIPPDASYFEVGFCCLADPDGTIFFRRKAAYHGEVTIDPTSGAIRRLTLVANLEPRLPMLSSAIMVEYGPVVIGEKTYICPTRSVSISRQRTVKLVKEWGQSFGVYGRFETILNDLAFGKYHLFRAESRILPGNTVPPNER